MGWTAVEPLSLGFFQIDPNAMQLNAEGNRVFNVAVVGRLSKEITEELIERLQKELAEEITEKATKEISEEATERITRESIEEAYEKVQANAMEKSGKNLAGAALDSAVKKEAGEIAATKLSKEVAEEGVEKTAKELAEEAAEKASKETAEKTAKQAKELSGMQKGIKDSFDKFVKYGVIGGVLAIGGWVIFSPLIAVFGSGVADFINGITGVNCREGIEKNYPQDPDSWDARTEKCEKEAQMKTMVVAAAGVGIVGLLGALIITRLIPKRKPKPQAV
jgi:histone H3/H4